MKPNILWSAAFVIVSIVLLRLDPSIDIKPVERNQSTRNILKPLSITDTEQLGNRTNCVVFDEILDKIKIIQSMTNIKKDVHKRYMRNLYITDTYKQLSVDFNQFLFEYNPNFKIPLSNWMSVAVWASNMVGTHIRKYSLYYWLLSIFKPISNYYHSLFLFFNQIINKIMYNQLEITSLALSHGNLIVFNDIAYFSALLARDFCGFNYQNEFENNMDITHRSAIIEIIEIMLKNYKLKYFKPHQYSLFEAYKHYIYIKYAQIYGLNDTMIREYMFYANLMIGYYEQQKLQKPLNDAVSKWSIFNYDFTDFAAKFVTQNVFRLCVGTTCHWLGQDIDIKQNEYIQTFVSNLNYYPLKKLLMKWYDDDDEILNHNGPENWLRLHDRMRYVVALFLFHINDTMANKEIFTYHQKQIIWNDYQIPPDLV